MKLESGPNHQVTTGVSIMRIDNVSGIFTVSRKSIETGEIFANATFTSYGEALEFANADIRADWVIYRVYFIHDQAQYRTMQVSASCNHRRI